MGLVKTTRIDEGPLDFMGGAARETGNKVANAASAVGQKVANSAPVRAAGDVIQAGQTASTTGDLARACQTLAKLLAKLDQLKGAAGQQQPQQPTSPQQQPTAQVPPQQQARAMQRPRWRGMARVDAGAQSQQNSDYQFSSFLHDTCGEVIEEGVWDFVKGAGGAVASKMRDKINQYADKPSIFKDIYHAGAKASQEGNARKAQQQVGEVEMQAKKTVAQIIQLLKRLGQSKTQAFGQALKSLPADMQGRINKIVGANMRAPITT